MVRRFTRIFRINNGYDSSFVKKAAIFLWIYFLSEASAEIPPVPPFIKGGRRGDFRKASQKAEFVNQSSLFGKLGEF